MFCYVALSIVDGQELKNLEEKERLMIQPLWSDNARYRTKQLEN
jgi:hypothetical protein